MTRPQAQRWAPNDPRHAIRHGAGFRFAPPESIKTDAVNWWAVGAYFLGATGGVILAIKIAVHIFFGGTP